MLGADDAEAAAAFLGQAPGEPTGSITWLEDTGNRTALEVETARPALLYVADNYHSGIRALVDGVETRVMRANFTFRAIPVGPGRHVVRFSFSVRSLHRGMAATAAGAVLLCAIWLAWRLVGRRRRFGHIVAKGHADGDASR